MGGASLQITFQAQSTVPQPYSMPIRALQQPQCVLFTHSFNGWGREAAMHKVVAGESSPCLQRGYTSAEGAAAFAARTYQQCIPASVWFCLVTQVPMLRVNLAYSGGMLSLLRHQRAGMT